MDKITEAGLQGLGRKGRGQGRTGFKVLCIDGETFMVEGVAFKSNGLV